MKAPRSGLGSICAAVAIAVAAPSAAAAAYVPPGNSAATQYTEAVPTAGGPKATGKSPHGQSSSPSKVLGGHNAHRLEEQGPQGKAAAEAVAATAPRPVTSNAAPQPAEPAGHGSSGGEATNGSGTVGGSAARHGGGSSEGAANGARSANPAKPQPEGSSGLGEVIGQATGSSTSGALGPLLPIAILATIAWSLLYVAKKRKRAAQ